MEDQQLATGDLTSASAADTAVADTEAAPIEPDAADVSDVETAEDSDSDDEATDDAEAGVVRFRQRRPATKWTTIAATVAAVLFVGAGAFAGAMMQPYLADRAAVATKLNVARTAANAITTLWTYTPDNIDKLADRASQYLTGDFQAAYRKYLDALIAPNKQAKITNTTQVVGAAVESLSGTDATAIVYTNTASTSPNTKDVPSLKYLSYRLVLQRDHARWLVTKMTTITSLDLTPKF
ncbi:mammalian cell entry protein [Mycobacterium paraterrae]|uniref:Mammalian cell entry protein n=1 Tax=Mycobacterium paraterrae TaxID=577492 RepID=A0ABY3VIL5_9MYCO|nr:mammalian cell entry protein [Mycobacterium paraterrae]UMB69255.1 mammalian cell entry protein [Mycobacterium paraterrae]